MLCRVRMRRPTTLVLAAALLAVAAAGAATVATVRGTAKADTLRGTAEADVIYGLALGHSGFENSCGDIPDEL